MYRCDPPLCLAEDCLAGSQVVECTFQGGHDLLYGSGDILEGPRLAWHFFCGHMPSAMREDLPCTLSQGTRRRWLGVGGDFTATSYDS